MSVARRRIGNWVRLASNLGLLLAEPKLRRDVGKQIRAQVDHITDALADRYDDVVDRVDSVTDALRGRSPWPSRLAALSVGVVMGTGIGIMLAPRAGNETRSAIRDKTTELKNRARESISNIVSRDLPSSARNSATGTEG